MSDPENPSQQVSVSGQDPDGRVVVTVNLNLPPWPSITMPAPPTPAPVIEAEPMPAPMPDPVQSSEPAPAAPEPTEPVVDEPARGRVGQAMDKAYVKVDSALNKVFMGLADDAKRFYKTYRFWGFALVATLPDLYKLAIDNHLIKSGPVPEPLQHIFNLIGFVGAASVVVKLKRKQQQQDDS